MWFLFIITSILILHDPLDFNYGLNDPRIPPPVIRTSTCIIIWCVCIPCQLWCQLALFSCYMTFYGNTFFLYSLHVRSVSFHLSLMEIDLSVCYGVIKEQLTIMLNFFQFVLNFNISGILNVLNLTWLIILNISQELNSFPA